MQYVCDAPDGAGWFRLTTEAEAGQESALMNHAVVNRFRRERKRAIQRYRPVATAFVERDIGLEPHIRRDMPCFLSLRDERGRALVTAMLPPGGRPYPGFPKIIVGRANADPYPDYGAAIEALAVHFGMPLARDSCFPFARPRPDLRRGACP